MPEILVTVKRSNIGATFLINAFVFVDSIVQDCVINWYVKNIIFFADVWVIH